MTISMYQASVPNLTRALNSLINIIEKGAAHADAKGIDPSVFVNSRLYPDMFPLAKQIQIASDISKKSVARLAGTEVPVTEDTESTLTELIDRIKQSVTYIETFSAEQINGTEEKEITIPIGKGESMTMQGWPYLSFFVLPNVYFHVATAYDILRHNGVEVGKRDYLGKP